MDLEQNIADIKEDIGNINGKLDQFVDSYPKPSKIGEIDLRSKWNRKIIIAILTLLLGGGGGVGIVTSVFSGAKEVKAK